MFKYLFCMLMVLVSYTSLAQTPEQLEMMRSLGIEDEASSDKKGLSDSSERTVRTTKNDSISRPSTAEERAAEAEEKLVPLADMSIYTKPEEEMTDEEVSRMAQDLLKGKITIKMTNITVYKTPFGREVCTVDVELKNASGKTLKDLYVDYHWGERGTFVQFSDVKPFTRSVLQMAGADEYCSHFYQERAKTEVRTCNINGLSQDECKKRILTF